MSMPMQRKRDQQAEEKRSSITIRRYHVHTWEAFLEEAKKAGLEVGFFENYSGDGLRKGDNHIKEEAIFFSRRKGIILYAYTFSGKTVNYAKLYGELQKQETKLTEEQKRALRMFNHWQNAKSILSFSMDARQGVMESIKTLDQAFGFHSHWSIKQEIQFVNIVEKDGADMAMRERITEDKLSKCNPIIREILGI